MNVMTGPVEMLTLVDELDCFVLICRALACEQRQEQEQYYWQH
jgi:hypothetical protein